MNGLDVWVFLVVFICVSAIGWAVVEEMNKK